MDCRFYAYWYCYKMLPECFRTLCCCFSGPNDLDDHNGKPITYKKMSDHFVELVN